MNWLCATLSQTFDSTGNSEIGLLLFACSWSLSLGIGVTSDIFQTVGKIEVTREELTIDVIVGSICVRQSFITRIGILSIPGALLEDIDVIIRPTSSLSVMLKENCSNNGYCLGLKDSLCSKPHSFVNDFILSTVF